MMHNCRLIPQVVHELGLPPGAHVALMAPNGIDILLFLLHREAAGERQLVVNDQIAGNWGREVLLPPPRSRGADKDRLHFKFTGEGLEIWTPSASATFDRFDAARAAQVRFVRLGGAQDISNSLVFGTGSLDAALAAIDSHILHRRLGAIEVRLGLSTLDEPLTPPVRLVAKGGKA